jgi:hypothetical protein
MAFDKTNVSKIYINNANVNYNYLIMWTKFDGP